MRRVYAVQFEIGLQGNNPEDITGRIILATKQWVSYWYKLRRDKVVNLTDGNGVLVPEKEHTIRITEARTGKGETMWEINWLRPSFFEETLMWEANCTVAKAVDGVETTIILRLGSRAEFIAPPRYFLKTPYLVKQILDNFECYMGGEKVKRTPEIVEVENIEPFVEFLRSDERRLPIVVFSTDNYSERFLADPEIIADKIAGLAHSYMFRNKWASFKFTDLVGKPASCYNGAVRIYWPGSNEPGLLKPDRPFLPDQVQFAGEKIGDRILAKLARVSAFHFSDKGITHLIREAIREDKEKNIEKMREKVTSGEVEREELERYNKEIFDEYTESEEKNRQLNREVEELNLKNIEAEEEIARLEDENETLRKNFALVRLHGGQGRESEVVEESTIDVAFSFVKDALAKAKEDFSDFITVIPNAEETAARSDFRQPDKVYNALWAINSIAEDYFRSKTTGESMGDFKSAFAEKGFEYKRKDSPTTKGIHGKDRNFVYKGESITGERHITIGSGSPKDCLQIYFHIDDSDEKFVICHCGRHLPFASHRT